jgi:hypothetical protein
VRRISQAVKHPEFSKTSDSLNVTLTFLGICQGAPVVGQPQVLVNARVLPRSEIAVCCDVLRRAFLATGILNILPKADMPKTNPATKIKAPLFSLGSSFARTAWRFPNVLFKR